MLAETAGLFKPLKTHGVNVTAVAYAPAFGFVYNNIDEILCLHYKARTLSASSRVLTGVKASAVITR